MSDEKKDVTHFTRYFGVKLPSENALTILIILLGIISGIIAEFILVKKTSILQMLLYGSSVGITIISLPAILTALLIKVMKRSLKLRHAMIAVIAITITYAAFFLISVFTYNFTGNYAIAYIPILLSDAGIYGYWFIINKVVLNQGKKQVFTAAIQPVLNTLILIPVSYSLFSASFSYNFILIKLWAGMFAFMLCGFIILYLMDRPSKKNFNFSGVELMALMVNQWLFGVKKLGNDKEIFSTMGIKRDLPISILALKGSSSYKAIFIKPDIHYGPINGLGGSMVTEYLGKKIEKRYKTTPFILHGAVTLEDNPVDSLQVSELWAAIEKNLPLNKYGRFISGNSRVARSSIDGCTTLGIRIGNISMLSLTRAPSVTEDIDNDIGLSFESLSSKYGLKSILIDAHNSRFESAGKEELKGIYKGSKYISKYHNSIENVLKDLSMRGGSKLFFGASHLLLRSHIRKNDLGSGYMSVGIFRIKNRSLCMVYFDSNNMLPKLRAELISFIKNKYGYDSEIYTTDTHAVNTLALPASNVLGRYTKGNEIIPILDKQITQALNEMEEVRYMYSKVYIPGFRVWGKGSEDAIMKVSRDTIKTGKKIVPFIIVGFFIIAAWAIYLA